MNIITGYRGEPHITAQEDRDINLGVVGKSTTDLYVLDVGQKLDADIVSANEIRIRDGVLIMQGCAASIDYGTYDSLTISNGSQGMERIDVIAAQYEKDGDTNVESVSLVVIEGTPAASDPAVPSLTSGSIQGGDSLVQMPLYYVNLDGVSIDSVEEQFTLVSSLADNGLVESGNNGDWEWKEYINGEVEIRFSGSLELNSTTSSYSGVNRREKFFDFPNNYKLNNCVASISGMDSGCWYGCGGLRNENDIVQEPFRKFEVMAYRISSAPPQTINNVHIFITGVKA